MRARFLLPLALCTRVAAADPEATTQVHVEVDLQSSETPSARLSEELDRWAASLLELDEAYQSTSSAEPSQATLRVYVMPKCKVLGELIERGTGKVRARGLSGPPRDCDDRRALVAIQEVIEQIRVADLRAHNQEPRPRCKLFPSLHRGRLRLSSGTPSRVVDGGLTLGATPLSRELSAGCHRLLVVEENGKSGPRRSQTVEVVVAPLVEQSVEVFGR
ncbi:MAG: hypothetical protein U1E65_17955 [Myxococcota bacterium]